jgi:hypothetical protein
MSRGGMRTIGVLLKKWDRRWGRTSLGKLLAISTVG